MKTLKEEALAKMDKIISQADDIKRRIRLLPEVQCEQFIYQGHHQIIDERLISVKKDAGAFLLMNSILDKFLEITNIKHKDFFKKDNNRKFKKKANDKANGPVADARRLFCFIMIKQEDKVISRYLNISRFQALAYKKTALDLIETNKKFKEDYENLIKIIKLDL